MEFAFILDPLASLKAYKDTSVAMMRALHGRGHSLFALEQRDLFWDGKQILGSVRPLQVTADDHDCSGPATQRSDRSNHLRLC